MPSQIKKNIYIIRHGQTEYNRKGVVQGSDIDADLNDMGRQQVQAFYNAFAHIHFNKIYTSRLRRTKQTVQPFVKNKGIDIESLLELNEMSWGHQEGKDIYAVGGMYKKMTAEWSSGNLDFKVDGGESPKQVFTRLQKAMNYIMSKENENTILICIHGRALRIMNCLLRNLPLTRMDEFPHDNLCLYLWEYQNQTFTPVKENYQEHLKGLQ